jgi:hypothetical protein
MILSLVCGMAALQGAAAPAEVTVYNQGFALVKETRQMALKAGRQTVAVQDVAAKIETNSVGIRAVGFPELFQVLEQNYRFDLINPTSILNKAVGSKITLHRVLPNGTKETVVGTLMSAPTVVVSDAGGGQRMTYNGMVLRLNDGSVLLNPSGEVEVPSIPADMLSRPTLVWDLDCRKAGSAPVELSYITQGMTWNADYVLTLDGEGTAGLLGWVTMTNNSGAAFKDAKLKLLAGDVNRPAKNENRKALSLKIKHADPSFLDGFAEESLFEYHLYTLQRPATLKDKETKQLSLLEGKGVKYEKKLIVDSMRDYGMYYPGEGEVGTGNLKPQVRVEFLNSKANGLGIPLPKGNVKVYQRDKGGSVQMLGEDQIDHTPKEERISLVVGRSFDVVAERKRTNFQKIGPREYRETFVVEVRNRKGTAEKVHVLERHYGDWKVTLKNMDFKKLDSTTMEFLLSLKAGETGLIEYTVDTRW